MKNKKIELLTEKVRGSQWSFSPEMGLTIHETRTIGYGEQLKDKIIDSLVSIEVSEVFNDYPKPDWIRKSFRQCDLLIIKELLNPTKAFYLNPKYVKEPPYPLVFETEDNLFVLIAPIQVSEDLKSIWQDNSSVLFSITT